MVISFLLLILALLVFIFGNDLMVCIAAFVFGLNPMLTTTLCPLLAKDVWRRDEYPVILQTIQISSKLSYALFAVVEGALFDLWGRYNPLIVIQIIVCMMGLAFMLPLFIGKSSRCSRDSL